ncbi:hypothetical protein MMC17_004561 [Xylographa soralifera]|nr:hypothetical protein [Xylographa soralifera]
MLTQCYHPETFFCGLNCRLHLRKRVQALGTFREASQLPTWSLTAKELPRGEKRSLEEYSTSFTTGKRRCGRLAFLPGTFRPLIILDDDGGNDYPVVPRPLCLKEKSTHKPVLIEDESAANSTNYSITPNAIENTLAPRIVSGGTTKAVGRDHDKESEIARCWTTGDHIPKAANQNVNRQPAAKASSPKSPLWSDAGSGVTNEQYQSSISWSAEQKHETVVPIPKMPKDNLSVKDRKRFFIETPTIALAGAMKKWISDTYKILDPQRSDVECWLHPKPPPPRKKTGRACGSIRYNFRWKDQNSSHSLSVSFGVVALVEESSLTEAQRRGFINEGWHLSHLCGNWTCCNWRHFTIEPGTINVQRNSCFMRRHGCIHNPPCMKHLKRLLAFATSPNGRMPLPEDVPVFSRGERTHDASKTKSSWLSCASQLQSTPHAEPEEIPGFSPVGVAQKDHVTKGWASYGPRDILPMLYGLFS